MTTPPASGPKPADGRTGQRSLLVRTLARPEVGVFLGAIAVYVFFLIAAPPVREASAMANILYQSRAESVAVAGVGTGRGPNSNLPQPTAGC